MASYVNSALMGAEKILYQAKISIWTLAPMYALGGLILLSGLASLSPVGIGLGLALIVSALLPYLTTELAITDKRVIAKFGVIKRQTVELNLQKIEAVHLKQSIVGRIFNFGSIVLAGAGNSQAPIPGISKPLDFKRAFSEAQHGAEK